jgi:hypothetical protein
MSIKIKGVTHLSDFTRYPERKAPRQRRETAGIHALTSTSLFAGALFRRFSRVMSISQPLAVSANMGHCSEEFLYIHRRGMLNHFAFLFRIAR